MRNKLFATIMLLFCLALASFAVAAANNPGHDSLYINSNGDTLNGNLNITGNLKLDSYNGVGPGCQKLYTMSDGTVICADYNYGSDVVDNGDFEMNVNNWTSVTSTISWNNTDSITGVGSLHVKQTGADGSARQSYPLNTGKYYRISGKVKAVGTWSSERFLTVAGFSGFEMLNKLDGTDFKIMTNPVSGTVYSFDEIVYTDTTKDSFILYFSDSDSDVIWDDVVIKEVVDFEDGDITAVNTDNTYILGGMTVGDVSLTFNETLLNETINALDTLKQLICNDGQIAKWNQTGSNWYCFSIIDIDTNTHAAGDGYYLFNDTTKIYFNETLLNATIDARSGTGTIGGTGSINYLSKFTGALELGNSMIYDDGTGVGIGTGTPGAYKLNVAGDTMIAGMLNTTGNINMNGNLVATQTWVSGQGFDADTNCSVDGSCATIVYNTDTVAWDKDASNDLTTTTSLSGDVSGVYNNVQISESAVGSSEIATGAVKDDEIDYTAVTLSDFTDDVGYLTDGNDSVDSSELDNICSTDGKVLKRIGGTWQCADSTAAAPVDSVFGRTGVVVAEADDYTWVQIDKTTSSLADITTRSAGDLSSGNLNVARLPTGGAWALASDLNIDSNALVIDNDNGGRVGIGTATPLAELHVNGKIAIGGATDTLTTLSYGSPENGGFQIHNTQGSTEERLSITDANPTYGSALIYEVKNSPLTVDSINSDAIKFIVKDTGYVGIGDSSPTAHLVVGSDAGRGFADGFGDVYVQNDLEVDGTIYQNNLAVATESWVGSQGFDSDTNCSVDGSCDTIVYHTNTAAWDKDASNDLTTGTSLSGDVYGVYNNVHIDSNAVGSNEIATGAVKDDEIDYTAVTLSDFTDDVGYLTDGNDSVDSSELDNICSTDGQILKRVGGTWQCAADSGLDESGVEGYAYDNDNALSGAWTVTSSGSNDINFDSNTFSIDVDQDRVGIGTATPGAKLHINGNMMIEAGATDHEIKNDGNNDLVIDAGTGGDVIIVIG